jgi:cyanate lyase
LRQGVPNTTAGKPELVSQLLAAKEASGKTFTQIGKEIGRTNLYTTQLFFNQVGDQTSACRRQSA